MRMKLFSSFFTLIIGVGVPKRVLPHCMSHCAESLRCTTADPVRKQNFAIGETTMSGKKKHQAARIKIQPFKLRCDSAKLFAVYSNLNDSKRRLLEDLLMKHIFLLGGMSNYRPSFRPTKSDEPPARWGHGTGCTKMSLQMRLPLGWLGPFIFRRRIQLRNLAAIPSWDFWASWLG